MSVFKLRILIDTVEETEIFRDIEILNSQNFEELHNAIIEVFGFEGKQMASFYLSNDSWEKGQEIGLFDMGMGNDQFLTMSKTKLQDVIKTKGQKLLYVYDFLKMWCFYIEVLEVKDVDFTKSYPMLAMSFGIAPDEDSKQMDDLFESDDLFLDEDPLDNEFENFENLDDFDI